MVRSAKPHDCLLYSRCSQAKSYFLDLPSFLSFMVSSKANCDLHPMTLASKFEESKDWYDSERDHSTSWSEERSISEI